jgi:hypothetical protein
MVYFLVEAVLIYRSKQIAPALVSPKACNIFIGISRDYFMLFELIKNQLSTRGLISLFLFFFIEI